MKISGEEEGNKKRERKNVGRSGRVYWLREEEKREGGRKKRRKRRSGHGGKKGEGTIK